MKKLAELQGQRILYKRAGSIEVHDAFVLELSPSGKYVRLGLDTQWREVEAVSILEVFPPAEPPAEPTKATAEAPAQ